MSFLRLLGFGKAHFVWQPDITIRDGRMAADLMTFAGN